MIFKGSVFYLDEKQKVIDKTVEAINDVFGEHKASTLEEAFDPNQIKGFIPTGNLAIDWVIGRPGIPLGRISEISGRYGSGKSTIVAAILGQAQRCGGIGVLIDAEKSYSPVWAQVYGVKPEELIYLDPDHLQGAFDEAILCINKVRELNSTVPMFIAVDSVSALPTAAELEKEDSTASKQSAEHAVVISEGLRRASKLIHDQNVALLFVSQLKDNPRASWGKTTHKIGGSAIDFSAGLLLELTRTGYITKDEKKIGQKIQVTSRKNKFNMIDPLRVRTFDLYYGEGFRPKEILLDFLVDEELGLVKQTKGWYEYEGSKYRKEELAAKLDDELLKVVYERLQIV